MTTNLALNKNAVASSYVAPFSPGRAVDGLNQAVRRWVCDVLPATLTVDLGEYYWINKIILRHMGGVGWSADYNLKGFALAHSTDNLNWYTFLTESGNTASLNEFEFSPEPARWVRLSVSNGWGLNINPKVASLVEMEVYECPYDPYLSSLAISSGTLSPAFNKKTFVYDVEVENNVSQVTVTPTADAASGSAIYVNSQTVQSGRPSSEIALTVGVNPIAIQVNNAGIVQKYTINVTRKSSAALLSNLTVQSPDIDFDLSPRFDSNTFLYTVDVTSDTTSVTVTPTAKDGSSSIKVNNANVTSGRPSQSITTNAGDTIINVDVYPQGSSNSTRYTVTVKRP